MYQSKIYIPKIDDQMGAELKRLGLEIQDAAIAVANAFLIEYSEILQQHRQLKSNTDSLGWHIKINRRSSQSLPYYRQYEKKRPGG